MFFKKHMNIVTKNGGKKSEKKILPESYVYREQKTMEKNRLEKLRKHVFYKHTNTVTKNGEKKREKNFFQEHTYIASYKRWKKSSGKVRKHIFINTCIL